MATAKPTPSKAKKPKAEVKREFEEIVEDLAAVKALSHVEQIAIEQAKTRVQP